MTRSRSAVAPAFAILSAVALVLPASAAIPPAPVAKAIPVNDTYFGVNVVDPYRWMEEPNSPELAAFLRAQNDRTRTILDAIPARKQMAARITALLETVNASSDLTRRGKRTFFLRSSPGATLAKLYVREPGAAERVLFDPAALNKGDEHVALTGYAPSDDGNAVALLLVPNGRELNRFTEIVDAASGRVAGDRLEKMRAVTGWRADGKAFYYMRLQDVPPGAPPAAVRQNVRTYEHALGTQQSADRVVFGIGSTPGITIDPQESAAVAVSAYSPWALGVIFNGVDLDRRVYVAPKADLGSASLHWTQLCSRADGVTGVDIRGDDIYVLSRKNAPRFAVLKTSAAHPDLANAQTMVAPSARVIDGFDLASDALYVSGRDAGIGRMARVDYKTGKMTDIPLPLEGTIDQVSAEPGLRGFLVRLQSWTVSPRWFAYNPAHNMLSDTKLDRPSPVDYSNVTSQEVQVRARDGVMIPLSIVHAKTMKRNGTNPVLLYAYGSYGVSSSPGFSASRLAWLERGGVYAVAHVRGGGENGNDWHLAGKDANKVNTVNDFIDCARWLVAQRYTSAAKLGGRGGSAGGITMGGALTQAPALFAAILDEIPVSDQLRIELSANGPGNVPEFGSVKTEDGFKNLYATSPIQHVTPGTPYPAVMLTTGINDPRVDPWQAAKMTAALQADSVSGKPVLLRVDYAGGHGLIGATRTQAAELAADEYSFLLWNMGEPNFQPAL